MRGSLKTSEARFSKAKTWLNALLLPHIATLVLLMLVAFAAFLELRADLILELLLAPVLLWLMSGTIGWFAYLPHVAEWTSLIIPTFTVLLIIAACLFSGCRPHLRHPICLFMETRYERKPKFARRRR